ncbi:MAG: ATP-binding protein [Muribaculaceae bacterium]|nr:ATP-binding protein [Muribaculaceae bacterium]
MKLLKYPIGIQTFADIINGGYVYVDKTQYVWRLVTQGKFYFLSRPRRFGKSLLLSTLEAFFRGRRELFRGLYIDSQDWDWQEYPVFHLALNGQDYNSVESLKDTLGYYIAEWENAYNIPADPNIATVEVRFANCIRRVCEAVGRQVVILVDEYDQPLLRNIEQGREELHNTLREHMQAFFSVLKAQDQYIKFAILTGISKFSKVSVFSGLNNLNDISLDLDANAICGISESEISGNFEESIAMLAKANEMTPNEVKHRLRREYDGYHFSRKSEGVYNPFSLLNAFNKKSFSHYWMASGTPSFLIKMLGERGWDLSQISNVVVSESDLIGSDRYLTNPIPMLFQSGYLTIKGYDKEFNEYYLDYPNDEVSEGFNNDLLKAYSGRKDSDVLIKNIVKDVRKGKAESFMQAMETLLADIPYDQILNRELHYENMMYLVMKLMGFYTQTEYKTSQGRIDMIVRTDRYIYVIEFKLHGTAEEAINQIKDKKYTKPFEREGKEIILIGAAFSYETRNLDSWLIESL